MKDFTIVAKRESNTNKKLKQLMAQNMAQNAMLQILLGMFAKKSDDWRDAVEHFRMIAEYALKNLDWEGDASEGNWMRSEALEYLKNSLNQLHDALLRVESNDPPPL